MTTKILSTYAASGYTLSPAYSDLIITRTGGVGGVGLFSGHYAFVSNAGVINETSLGSNAVYLAAGGEVFNQASGYISGVLVGVGSAASVRVENYGILHAGYYAVYGLAGGSVTNGSYAAHGATMAGAVVFSGAAGAVTNHGTIDGAVRLSAGGVVTNGGAQDPAALINSVGGVSITGAYGTIANFGTIQSYGPYGQHGVYLSSGLVTNGSVFATQALIEGKTGVEISGYGAVSNLGSIRGVSGAYGAAGVVCHGFGFVTNGKGSDRTAAISGGEGVRLEAGGAVLNRGTIVGLTDSGVTLLGGGGVTNGGAADRTALIEGYGTGVVGLLASAYVRNLGIIADTDLTAGAGVILQAGGTITNGSPNNATARIEGPVGISMDGAGSVVNFGTVAGTDDYYQFGVVLGGSEVLTNGAAGHGSALIEGYGGVLANGLSASATVINFGAIVGTGRQAVLFKSATDTLVVEAGCSFVGGVDGGGGVLDLDTGVGTLTGLFSSGGVTVSGSMAATTFQNFATVVIGAAANFNTSGAVILAAGQTVNDVGVLTLGSSTTTVVNGGLIETSGSGALTIKGPLQNTGVISANGGILTVKGAVTGAGSATIGGGTLDLVSSFTENITFTGPSGTLELAQSQTYAGQVTGFSKTGGTFLDLLDISFGAGTTATYAGNKKSGTLTVTDGTHTAQIALKGDYRASTFVVASDGLGGTLVHDPAAFIAAMAGMAGESGAATYPALELWRTPSPFLASPGTHLA